MQNKTVKAFVYSKDGTEVGVNITTPYRCRMEGCLGMKMTVKWPDGKYTRPCTKGMFTRPDGNLQIG